MLMCLCGVPVFEVQYEELDYTRAHHNNQCREPKMELTSVSFSFFSPKKSVGFGLQNKRNTEAETERFFGKNKRKKPPENVVRFRSFFLQINLNKPRIKKKSVFGLDKTTRQRAKKNDFYRLSVHNTE